MRMIPPEISLTNPSDAERRLFEQLRAVELGSQSPGPPTSPRSTPGRSHSDGGDWVVLHSLNLSEHLYKTVSEIDFLLLGPRGLYVLEVKGGRVSCRDGVWTFTDRHGRERRRNEGPFGQARSAMYSLLDRLRDLGNRDVDQITHGYGVVIPDHPFEHKGVEWDDAMVLDETKLEAPDGLRRYLLDLFSYWEGKKSRPGRLDPMARARLLRHLRPQFDLVPTLRHTARDIDERLEWLTDQQYKYLEAAAGNPRLLCSGGAGTGKTFLAVEVARREAAAGRRVLLTCHSPVLAGFIRQQVPDGSGIVVRPFADVPSVPDSFDAVVVDEAQDLLNVEALGRLDEVLVGGLSSGRWRFFYDINNQSGLVGSFDSEAFSLLEDAHPSVLHLPDNCRNTARIVENTKLLTGADIGVTTAGEGPDVRMWFHRDASEAVDQLSRHLDDLVANDVPLEDIAILTAGSPDTSLAAQLSSKWRGRTVPMDTRTALASHPGAVVLARIDDFKGLERRFVAVVDIDRLDTHEDLSRLYVAMTRARAGLWMTFPAALRGRVEQLVAEHTALVFAAEGERS